MPAVFLNCAVEWLERVGLQEMTPDVQDLIRRLLRAASRGEPAPSLTSCPAAHDAVANGWIVIREDQAEVTKAGRTQLRRVCTVAQLDRAAGATAQPSSGAHRQQATSLAATAPANSEPSSPLAWLRRRKDREGNPLISQEQFSAGERLAADLWRARMTPRITSSWSGMRSDSGRRGAPGTGIEIPDMVIAAGARVEAALASVGPELAGVLIDVCGDFRGIEDLERSHGWPQRSGKIILQLALTQLARHYGLIRSDPLERSMRQRISGWAADDFAVDLNRWRS